MWYILRELVSTVTIAVVSEKSKYSKINHQENKSFIFLYNFMNKNLNHLTTPQCRGGRDRLPKTPAAWGCSSRSTSQRMLYHTDCIGEDTKTNFRKIHSISPSLALALALLQSSCREVHIETGQRGNM